MNQKKKMAAALTAVSAYIISGQEAQMTMAQAKHPAGSLPKAVAAINSWAIFGRQSHMQMRNLVQMKSFLNAKFR